MDVCSYKVKKTIFGVNKIARYFCRTAKNGTQHDDDNETYKTHKETVPQGKVNLYVLNNILAGLPEMEGLFFCPNLKGSEAKIESLFF